MRIARIVRVLTFLICILFVLFLLPNFQITVAGNQLSWHGIDFNILGLNSTLANFRRGSGLYPDIQVKFAGTFSQQTDVISQLFYSDLNTFQNRALAAGLSDVKVESRTGADGKSEIIFNFPNNYGLDNAEGLSRIITQPGVIQFWVDGGANLASSDQVTSFLLQQQFPDYKAKLASISVSDLVGISVEARSNLQTSTGDLVQASVWRLTFSPTAQDRLTEVLSASTTQPPLLVIDGEPAFTLHAFTDSTDIIAIPLYTFDNRQLRTQSTYLTVAGRVFGQYEFTSRGEVLPVYTENSRVLLIAAMLALGIAVFGWILIRYKVYGVLNMGFALAAFELLNLALWKLAAVSISTGLVLAFILNMLVGTFIVRYLFTSEIGDLGDKLVHIRNVGLVIFLSGWAVYNSGLAFGIGQEMMGVMSVMGLAIMILSITSFKYIFNYPLGQNNNAV